MIIRPSDHTITYYFRTKSFSYKIPQGAFKNCVDNGKGIPLRLYVKGNMHIIFDITNTTTDKRTDVWSRDFIMWKINSGLWAVAWARLWEKRVWADYEQLLRPVFSLSKVKKFLIFF